MDPREFEHVVAAAAEVTDQDEFVVIGSQAILASCVLVRVFFGSHPRIRAGAWCSRCGRANVRDLVGRVSLCPRPLQR